MKIKEKLLSETKNLAAKPLEAIESQSYNFSPNQERAKPQFWLQLCV